jgi:PAS domain S-box-containing protein
VESHPTQDSYQDILKQLEEEKKLRLEAEETAADLEERLDHVFDMIPAGIYEIDFRTGGISNVNDVMCAYSGYTREEFLNLKPWDLLTPESRELYEQRMEDFLSGKEISAEVHYTIRTRSGEELRCLLNNRFVYKDGQPVGAVVIVRDVTTEWRAQETLRSQAMALEQSFDGIGIFTLEGEVIFVNQAWADMHGYETAQELTGKNLRTFHSPDQYESQIRFNLTDPVYDGANDAQVTHLKKDGAEFPTRMSTSIIKDDSGKHVALLAIAKDITHSLRMEERLRHAQKMEAIGVLAGGIAHDFNNILHPLMGYAELALEDIPSGNPASECVREIVRATGRAKSLVSQILSFSRFEKEEQKPINLSNVVKEVLALIRASLPAAIRIQEEFESAPFLIMGNPTQVHQVVMNLCTNAYQAMKESGGLLKVSLKMESRVPGDMASLPSVTLREYAKLEIQDTGGGMEPHVASRIFEPYFTTKPKGKGTGLGLAMVHTIMTQHKGEVCVDTLPGYGSTFTLYFPVLHMEGLSEGPRETVQAQGGEEKILLVDDEDSITMLLERALGRLGYRIDAYTSSAAALESFSADPDGFDLAILDVSMPEMTGDALLKKIKEIRPDFPCILFTGNDHFMSKDRALELGACQLLAKPLRTQAMAAAIRQALDSGDAQPSE